MTTDLVIKRFDPYSAAEAVFVNCYNVFAASHATDWLDEPCLPLAEYIARLRDSLPDRSTMLLVGCHGDKVVGLAQVDFLADEENSTVGISEVIVHPDHRRAGIGTALLRAILLELKGRDRRVVECWQVVAGAAGQWWAEALGFRVVHRVVRQLLVLPEVDRSLWQVAVPAGYRLQRWVGAAPDSLLGLYALARGAIHDAPTGETAYRSPEWTAERVRDAEAKWREKGFEQRVVVAVDEATGTVSGFTEVLVHPRRPDWGYQRDTAVLAAHRGRGLGRCMKAHMAQWLVSDQPKLERIATATGAGNTPMIRVNHEVGYTTLGTVIAVQQDLATLAPRLGL